MAFFGLSLGSVLLLAAIGLAITFGVMGVINMAHGEFLMLGAYTTFVVQQWVPVDWSLPVAIPLAFLVAGAVGVLLERGLIRFLYGRPLETLLATFGVSLILQQVVRSVFSPLNRQVATPSWMSGSHRDQPGPVADAQSPLHRHLQRGGVRRAAWRCCASPASAWNCARCRRTAPWRARWACAARGSMR